MIHWLNTNRNSKGKVNENYARELMEIFTLGPNRGAYTETDVREVARAMTGWRGDTAAGALPFTFVYDVNRHDVGDKTIFGQRGNFDWKDVARLVIDHPLHGSFFIAKLWTYFCVTPLPPADVATLVKLYTSSGNQIRPVLEAILTSKAFYEGPRMVKPPVVYLAGLLRARQRFIKGEAWDNTLMECGQKPYFPPDVGGWDDSRWLDTSTMHGRWGAVFSVMKAGGFIPKAEWGTYSASETATAALDDALKFWNRPPITEGTRARLLEFAASVVPTSPNAALRAQRQNALRQLIAAGPDNQTC